MLTGGMLQCTRTFIGPNNNAAAADTAADADANTDAERAGGHHMY
jgi:hypothetical protein